MKNSQLPPSFHHYPLINQFLYCKPFVLWFYQHLLSDQGFSAIVTRFLVMICISELDHLQSLDLLPFHVSPRSSCKTENYSDNTSFLSSRQYLEENCETRFCFNATARVFVKRFKYTYIAVWNTIYLENFQLF